MRGYETPPPSFTIESVQNWWEVPCIAHFCSLFRLYFELLDFDIEELEEALLTDGVEDSGSSLLQDLIVRLLRGCYNTKDEITSSNYQMYLRRLFRIKCEEDPTKNNPFDGDVAFHSLPLRTKVEILRDLCDFRLDNEDVSDALKTLEARSLRVEPLGQDSGGSTYWYFYGTRLYREDYSTTPVAPPVRRRGRRRIEPQPPEPPQLITKWQVVCFTEQDWQVLANKFKNCKSSSDRNLHRTLSNDFLPELPRLFAEKEKLLRLRMLDQQLRRNGRSSSFHVDDFGVIGEGSSSVNGCGASGVNGIGAGSSAFSLSCNGILGAIKPSRLKNNNNKNPNRVTNFINSISSILDKSNISFLKRFNQTYNNYHNNLNNNINNTKKTTNNTKKATNNTKKTTNNKKKKVGGRSSGGSGSASAASSSASTSPTPTATATATCSSSSGSSKALRGGYNDNSWSQGNNDDDNNNKINAMDLDDEHSERECSPTTDEEELRRRREEQERADRLLAEAIEREERKARLHLRERRGGAFSSPSNAGSRNSSTVSTDRAPQSIKASTVSKQTVAAAVSKKNSKASPVKASPVKKKGSKSKSGKKGGRMTNNSLSVSLSPLVDDEEGEVDPDNVDGSAEKKKKKKKKKKHHVATEEDEGQTEEFGEEEEGELGEDEEVVPKKKSKSTKSSADGSPKKTISTKKKKKHSSSKSTTVSSRSPSPTSHTPATKKMKKSSKTSPISPSKNKSTSKKLSKKIVESENEEENQMEVDDELVEEEEEEEFCEEEEEADYESIVARTLHNNNNNKVKGKGAKEKGKSKEKAKSKEKKRALLSGDDEDDDALAPAEKKSKASKEKVKEGGSKKSKKSSGEKVVKSGKGKELGKKSKSSSKSESSTAGLIGASSMNLGSGTSKTKVKSSVLFSQSEEDVQIGMHKVIEAIKNHRDAWPFINPVDEDYAPNYYKIIDDPMDLQTMEDKLDNQEYASLDEFKIDFGRIVDNCRKYNGPINEYTEMVETVEQAFNKLLQRYVVPDESDEEISIEYANTASSERKRPSSHSTKKKDKEASKSSVGGGKEISKEHKKENEPTPKSPSKKGSSSKLSSSANDEGDVNEDDEKLERKKKKQQLMRHHSRDSEVIEGLASAAAETLKDLNTWLETTPRPPEKYGENSSVPTSEKGGKTEASLETGENTKTNKAAKIPPSSSATSSPSPVMKDKKTKKLLSSSGTVVTPTPQVGQKRKLEFSSNKKARSTQFIMDEDDEYNIDRDLSPPPPKITKKKDEGTPGKVKGSKKNKVKDAKKDVVDPDGKVKEKGKKDKHHHHHHKHHHHHHHHHSHKRDSSSAEESPSVPPTKTSANSGTKPKATSGEASGTLKNSMSSSSSVSSMSTNSSTIPTKPKGKKPKSSSDDPTAAPTKKPKSSKAKSGLGSTGNLLNTLKNSAAYKRMNQISRATKALSSSEPSNKFKSDALIGLGVPPVAPGSTSLEATVSTSASATRDMDGVAEKKKCLLVNDLPGDKEGAPKLSLGSVLSTDAIKLVNLKENEDELSDEDDGMRKTIDVKSEKDIVAEEIKKEEEEEEEKEDEEIDRKLEPSKGFNRDRCMPNLSAWIKAFGGPVKSAPGNGSATTTAASPTAVATVSPLISPVKRPDPESKNKFRVMGRGVGEPEGKSHVNPTPNKPIQPIPHHPSVIKTSSSIPSPSSVAVPVVRHHPAISDSLAPTWSPITPLPGPSPTSNPMLNPIKQAALAAAERSSSGAAAAIEDLSSSPRHHTSKKHRNRKMSSSSLSSQSESGSPICVTSSHDGIGGSGTGGYISGGGSGGVVVNPPRWVDDHPWGPVSQSQSPSASSHVSSQSPAGPNSPFSPSISSPPPSTPQTPPRPTAPVRVGFYQDTTASQHSSPEKVNESQSSPATPPTPNSVHGSTGSGGSTSNANNGSSSRRGTSGNASSSRGESGYPSSATSHYAPRYVASTPSPNISGGPGSNASSGLPSPSTPASNTSGGIAESPGNPNSPHSPKVVNMSNTASSSGSGGAADYRSHSSSGGGAVTTSSSSSSSSTPVVNGPQTPAHQQSSRSGASSVLHSTLPYGTPPAHHYSSPSMMEQHLRNSAASHQLPDPAHSHHLHSPSSSAHSHHHQTPAHAHSNAPQTSHAAHAHSIGHLGQPQQAHAGSSSSNQYHSDSGSSRYPPNLPHAHQQSSTATSSTTSGSSYSSSGSTSSHQNLALAHAHSRQPTSQPHLSHPYPSNPYTSNPRSINVAPSVYSNPISSDPAMNRYYKATAGATELSLSLGSSGGASGSSSSSTAAGANSTSSSSSSTKRSSRSNASANTTPSPHPDIPRSASVNPATAAAMAAAFEGKLGPAELNGFWPHNIASLTQIVNNIPHAYRHYAADPESLSKYQRAAAAAAAAESNSYPVTTSSGSGVSAGVITSGAKSAAMQSSGSSVISSHHHHHSHHSSSEKGSSISSSGNSGALDHHTHHHHHSESSSSVPTTSSGKKQSKSSSESKSSRSQSNASGKSSSSTSGGGIVPGSAFNFSSLTPDSLALYSKEMSDHAASGGLYSVSPPTLTPPLAHRASEFYPTASSASHFSHHSSFSAAARSSAGGVPTPPITPYPFIPGSHPSPYQAHQPVSSQPFAAHSQSSRGLDPYQLFQGSPHVMGLLSHPSGYPAPYAHPHSSLGFNWPGGRI